MRKLGLIGAVAVLAVTAGSAWAAVGDLTPAGCIEDNDDGPDSCTASLAADGLQNAREVAVSADGRDVYAVGFDDKAVVPLRRDAFSGALSYIESCIADHTTIEACGTANGMDGASTVAVSPDGANVYVGSEVDGSIAILDRDTSTGALSWDICVEDDDAPGVGCGSTVAALNDVRSLAISPDGEHLYAASIGNHAIQILDRFPGGALADAGCVQDSTLGSSGCATSVAGLSSVRGVTVSPDGASVYATGESDDALVAFSRNPATGALTGQGCFSDDGGGGDPGCIATDGLNAPYAAAVSPDGKSLYVAANADDAVKRFDRSSGGALTARPCVDDSGAGACAQSMAGLDAPTRLVISGDGLSVYAAANGSDAVASLARDPSTGALTPAGCVGDVNTGPAACASKAAGLDAVWGIAISPDASSLYAASRLDNAVVHIRRALAPVPGKSLVVKPVAGTVTVKLPGAAGFVPIQTVTSIPVGSEVDTTNGTANLTSRATGSAVQSADFKFGRFRVTQSAKKSAYTELKLTGPLGCKTKGKKRGGRRSGAAASGSGGPVATVARRRGRSLWGSGHGKFRTSGRKGSGAARGTIWQVTDLCSDRTRIKSIRGNVQVRDFVRKRSLTIRTGQGYLAPGPKTLEKGKR